MSQLLALYRSTLGKKVAMAITGIVLFGYVVGHMLGNLQIYLGPEPINAYAEFLHGNPGLLWGVRLLLLVAVVVHIVASVQVWLRNRASRPVKYRRFRPPEADYAARTMIWSGPIVAAFVIYHVLHLTTGTVHPDYQYLDVYHNVTTGFMEPLVSAFYIVANLLLAVHLYHGMWSLFQTMGWEHPRYNAWRRWFAAAFAVVIGAGNISIPVAVLTGLVG
jgi:succinate dehydrogenase / fumarate reductase cytochrome b subunit